MEHATAAAAAAAPGGGGGFHGYRSSSTTTTRPPTHSAPPSGVVKLLAEINNNGNVVDGAGEECTVREQDRFMPIANVIRIMRKILPQHAKISDDAKETIQECVSEYISFITSEANERCQREQRKTITAEDVLFAMSKLGFDDYIEPLTVYLHRYRELEGDRAGAGSASSSLGLKRSGSGNGGGFMVEYLGGGSSSGFGTAPFHPHHHVAPPPHSRHPVHNGFYGGANVSPRGNGAASNGENRGHPIFGHHRHHHDRK